MFGKTAFEGDWEEKYVFGPRIEIRGKNITVLWRSSPVLETKFTADKEADGEGRIYLHLENTGMRYVGAASDYASVAELYLKDEKLYFVEDFPITGISKTEMVRTSNSRYGDYSIEDKKMLPLLAGRWVSERGGVIEIKKNRLTSSWGFESEIRVLHSNGENLESGRYEIVPFDPGKREIGGFAYVRYEGGVISAPLMIHDAPLVPDIYHKEEK